MDQKWNSSKAPRTGGDEWLFEPYGFTLLEDYIKSTSPQCAGRPVLQFLIKWTGVSHAAETGFGSINF